MIQSWLGAIQAVLQATIDEDVGFLALQFWLVLHWHTPWNRSKPKGLLLVSTLPRYKNILQQPHFATVCPSNLTVCSQLYSTVNLEVQVQLMMSHTDVQQGLSFKHRPGRSSNT